MNKRSAVLTTVAALLLGLGVWAAHRMAFDWRALGTQLRSVSILPVLIGCACIYAGFVVRALRWHVLLGPTKEVPSTALIAPQFVGFAAVALFGRLADLARPYLIARRTNSPVASQIAAYSIERIFDLAAAAILFSVTLALAPRNLPHHGAFARAGLLSLIGTFGLGAFALGVRFAGERIADLITRLLRPISPTFAETARERILDFRKGLFTLRDLREVLIVLVLSVIIWLGIAECYVQSARAFPATPLLVTLSFTQIMLLMATSMGGSLLQLPVVGWFTQIALLAAAVHTFFGTPLEAATAWAAVLLFMTTLSVIPAGLIAARISGTSLRGAAHQSEQSELTTT